MTKTIVFVVLLLSFSIAYACISPDNIKFVYPIDLSALKESGKFVKISSNELEKDYTDYIIGVNENGLIVTCKKIGDSCLNKDLFRKVLQDMEDMHAYDISKEDKDTIASFFKIGVTVKEIPKEKIIVVKLKNKILEFLGKIFCTRFEKIIECNGNWCSLQEIKSEKCTVLEC